MSRKLENIRDWGRLAREADFKPAKMAALCNVSERQLERHFKEHMRNPPRRWLQHFRCGLAKELMARGYSTKAVAKDLKFASASHFCHVFKRTTGVSPQQFAPRYRKKKL
jgi:AraC family transcriptional regulator